jgi:hypothetical protein
MGMRYLLLMLLACGGPTGSSAFAPVTVTLQDDDSRGFLTVSATKKLNPACAESCEMAVAIEDGGCGTATIDSTGFHCEGSGGLWVPLEIADGGSATRQIAIGAEIELLVHPGSDPSCSSKTTVTQSGLTISVSRAQHICSFTTR